MKRLMVLFIVGCVVLAVIPVHAAPQKEKAIAAPPSPPAMEQTGPVSPSGKVVETMNSGGYTYVCLEKNGKKTWVAVPETKITVGKEMTFRPGQAMTNFESRSLNRTFDVIVFSAGVAEPGQQSGGGLPPGHGGGSVPGGTIVTAKAKDVKVEKATGPDAYTVGEVFEKRTALHQKTAVIRGTVVKFTAGIMGRNWVHLQDGTGSSKKGTHNLVVTTQDKAAVGDVVTVKGTVIKDRDFGAGYKYSVIIEEASIQQ